MSHWTPQRLIDDKMTVTAYCHNSHCHHKQQVDLQGLLVLLGPDAPAMHDDLAPRFRCSKCGGKAVGLIYSPDTTSRTDRSSAYAKAKGR